MYENPYNVHFWFELRKGLIPEDVKDEIEYYRSTPDNIFGITVFETTGRFYLKTPIKLIEDKYYFSIFTGGWQNLEYRIYLELDPSKEVYLMPVGDYGNKTIKGHTIGIIIPREACFINDVRYYLKIDDYMAPSITHIGYVLSKNK